MINIAEEDVKNLPTLIDTARVLLKQIEQQMKSFDNTSITDTASREKINKYLEKEIWPKFYDVHRVIYAATIAYNQDPDNWSYTPKQVIIDAQLFLDESHQRLVEAGIKTVRTKLSDEPYKQE